MDDAYQTDAFLKLLAETTTSYLGARRDEVEYALSCSLAEIGEFFELDRVYIFEYDWAANECSNTVEWCRKGITGYKDQLQNVSLIGMNEWVRQHRLGKKVIIQDVEFHEEEEVKKVLTMQSIKSLVTTPVFVGEQCHGFVGFDSVRVKKKFSVRELQLLDIYAQVAGGIKLRVSKEIELEQTKNDLQAFFDSTVDPLAVLDLDGIFIRVSDSFSNLMGCSKKNMLGYHFSRFVDIGDLEKTKSAFDYVRKAGELRDHKCRFVSESGDVYDLSWSLIRHDERIYASGRDITNAEIAKRALETSLDRAKDAEALKTNLIELVSHKFRTPLALVRLHAEILIESNQDNHGLKDDLNAITENVERLAALIDRVVSLGGTEVPPNHVNAQKTNIIPLIKSVITSFPKEIQTKFRIDPVTQPPCHLNAFPKQPLEVVFFEVMKNCVNFSPIDSHVKISISPHLDVLEVVFENECSNFDDSELKYFCDPLYRGSNAVNVEGSGIGLSIVQKTLVEIGGKLSIEQNKPGRFRTRIQIYSDVDYMTL